jgi:XTP/dITP diphosphohydrolase
MAADVRRIVVATANAGKLAEIRGALALPGWQFVTVEELGLVAPDVEESGDTFSENAFLKAKTYRALTSLPALADDSGLVVDALGGRPGVRSSRFAGERASDTDNNRKLLAELDGFGPEMRAARFQCVLVLLDENDETTTACGTCEGHIGMFPRGAGGFGYDPLFMPAEAPGRSMAELEVCEKNAISHRGKALAALRAAMSEG